MIDPVTNNYFVSHVLFLLTNTNLKLPKSLPIIIFKGIIDMIEPIIKPIIPATHSAVDLLIPKCAIINPTIAPTIRTCLKLGALRDPLANKTIVPKKDMLKL